MNVAFQETEELPSRKKFTADDVVRMVEAGILREDDNVELIEGELVMMSAKHIPHESIKHALNKALSRAVGDDLYVAIETSLRLADDIIVEPDITVISSDVFSSTRHGLATPQPRDVRLLVEIAASTMTYDRRVKARLYARYGITEFWVIDANERTTWVHTGPSGDGWTSIVARGTDDVLATDAVPGFSIRLADIG